MIVASSVNYTNCTTGQVRLSGFMEGRVELCHDNVWYGICGDSDYSISSAVCRNIGYQHGMYLHYFDNNALFIGSGYRSNFAELQDLPLYPYEFYCSGGTQQSLLECSRYSSYCYSSTDYYNGDYVGVTCQSMACHYMIICHVMNLKS